MRHINKVPLVTDEVYHIYNRGINKQPTFNNKKEYERAVEAISFYQYAFAPIKLSKYLRLPIEEQNEVMEKIADRKQIEILSYVLMPNHFHFLLRQIKDKGISRFASNFQNSYTRYSNTRQRRDGAIFLRQFKAVRIEDDDQLVHVSRYIHLNPYTSYIVSSLQELTNYPWSSIDEYLNPKTKQICETSTICSFFNDPKEYSKFIFDQANYQRELKEIEHLILE